MAIKYTNFNAQKWAVSPKPLPAKPGMVPHLQLTNLDDGRRISIPAHMVG